MIKRQQKSAEVLSLGTSTDGVSKEMTNNLSIIIKYLDANSLWVALIGPKNDNKTTRYQPIGQSENMLACIRCFVFDSFLLVLANTKFGEPTRWLWRFLPHRRLRAVVVVSLAMTRMRYFAFM